MTDIQHPSQDPAQLPLPLPLPVPAGPGPVPPGFYRTTVDVPEGYDLCLWIKQAEDKEVSGPCLVDPAADYQDEPLSKNEKRAINVACFILLAFDLGMLGRACFAGLGF